MAKENLGGWSNSLCVSKSCGKYLFTNERYGMKMYVDPKDIREVLRYPNKYRWGDGGTSYSNDVDGMDKKIILDYLRNKACKYKTVDDLMNSRSKYKEKYLMQFSMEELQEYIKKKEDKDVKVESCN